MRILHWHLYKLSALCIHGTGWDVGYGLDIYNEQYDENASRSCGVRGIDVLFDSEDGEVEGRVTRRRTRFSEFHFLSLLAE